MQSLQFEINYYSVLGNVLIRWLFCF